MNFVGAGVTSVTVSNNTASVNIPAQSGIEVYDDGVPEGTAYIIDFQGATVGFTGGTASVSYPNTISGIGVSNESGNVVSTAKSLIFSGSGATVTQVNTNTASIHIPGGGGNPGGSTTNIQYNSGSSFGGAATFNFISSSNQVEISGSFISSGSYAIFSSSFYANTSSFFPGLTENGSITDIITYNTTSGQIHHTSSTEFQRVNVNYLTQTTSSKLIEFTGSGVSVSFNGQTASVSIPSYINPGPTGYLAFYSGSSSQSLYPVSSSNQIGAFWDITNNRLGINKITPEYTLEVSGSFGATTKSFIIPHQTQEGKSLQYGVTEGPEHSVFIRGKSSSNIIDLPEEWEWLIDENTITVDLTCIGRYQKLFVHSITNKQIQILSDDRSPVEYFYKIFAERKDVPKLKTII